MVIKSVPNSLAVKINDIKVYTIYKAPIAENEENTVFGSQNPS
jgi:hypothetical protein